MFVIIVINGIWTWYGMWHYDGNMTADVLSSYTVNGSVNVCHFHVSILDCQYSNFDMIMMMMTHHTANWHCFV